MDATELNTGSLQRKDGTSITCDIVISGNMMLCRQLLLLLKLDSTSIGNRFSDCMKWK